MRYFFHWIVLCFVLIACGQAREKKVVATPNPAMTATSTVTIPDSFFVYHFRILDSVAQKPPEDSCYHCCYTSIEFMQQYTGIDADVDGDYFGPIGFKKEDLRKWHEWFDRQYKHKGH